MFEMEEARGEGGRGAGEVMKGNRKKGTSLVVLHHASAGGVATCHKYDGPLLQHPIHQLCCIVARLAIDCPFLRRAILLLA